MHPNLTAAWIGIVFGVLSGFAMGLWFHREDWLGGYDSLRRRLYRLAHISLFGLALINVAFSLTAGQLPRGTSSLNWASSGFIVGAVTMPVCCLLMAHWPRLRGLFAIPVLSLLASSCLTLIEVVRL